MVKWVSTAADIIVATIIQSYMDIEMCQDTAETNRFVNYFNLS